MVNKIVNMYKIIKYMGLDWCIYRSFYEARKRSGILKNAFSYDKILDDNVNDAKIIRDSLENLKLDKEIIFDFDGIEDASSIKQANDICDGKFIYFSHKVVDWGNEINWHKNPLTGYEFSQKHWFDIEELDPDAGDIKMIWEISRFSWVFPLVSAYRKTRESKYPECFWGNLESFIDANPYEIGINWKCGQEISMRSIAIIFAMYHFKNDVSSTDARVIQAVNFLYYSALHVEKHFEFALYSVRNNHTISEAVGMFTVGVTFPFFKSSMRLKEKGNKYAQKVATEQIYEDGSYIQNSMNYERLVLQTMSWYVMLAKNYKVAVTEELKIKLNNAINFLHQMQDENSGFLPNYGNNDGALLFPLVSCEYRDYRATLKSLDSLLNNENHLAKRESSRFDISGYYALRFDKWFVMMRCGEYLHRPAHADMMHVDIWENGENIFLDGGTFSYNTDAETMKYFLGTQSHNTLMINGNDQMTKAGRFIWLDWAKGFLTEFLPDQKMSGEMRDFQGVNFSREINVDNDFISVIDTIEQVNKEAQTFSLNWNTDFVIEDQGMGNYLLTKNEHKYFVEIVSLNGSKLDVSIKPAWYSSYYQEKRQIQNICISGKIKDKIIIKTSIRSA